MCSIEVVLNDTEVGVLIGYPNSDSGAIILLRRDGPSWHIADIYVGPMDVSEEDPNQPDWVNDFYAAKDSPRPTP